MSLTPKDAFSILPATLRSDLLSAFNEIVKNYREHRWEPSELNGGKLCEAVYTICKGWLEGGKYPTRAEKPSRFPNKCWEMESTYQQVPNSRSARILVPRMMMGLYDIRNNRGVGHAGARCSEPAVARSRSGLRSTAPSASCSSLTALVTLLSAHVASYPVDPDEWLFTGPAGDPPHQNTVGYWWRKTLRDAGLSGIKLHDLRHFFASGLIAEGCDVVTVQRALGHSKPTTTLNTYAHLWPTAEDRTRKASQSLMDAATSGVLADSVRTEST